MVNPVEFFSLLSVAQNPNRFPKANEASLTKQNETDFHLSLCISHHVPYDQPQVLKEVISSK